MSRPGRVLRREVGCEDVVDRLAAVADGEPLVDLRHRSHVEGCLRCQAEIVQYRKLLRRLSRLRSHVIEPAPGLVGDVLAAVHQAGEQQAVRSLTRGRQVSYVVGITAASAAAVVGVAVLGLRGRGRRIATAER